MKKKLSKSLSRIQKFQANEYNNEDEIKKLSPYEISVFRSLKKKYDLSVISKNLENKEKDSDALTKGAKITLDRINKGIRFVFKKQ